MQSPTEVLRKKPSEIKGIVQVVKMKPVETVLEQGTAIHPIPIHHIAFISCSVDEMESRAPLTDRPDVLPQSS